MNTRIRRKKKSRNLKKTKMLRRSRRKTRKMYLKKGGEMLKTIKISMKPSVLSSDLVSSINVSNTNFDVEESLAEIVAGRIKQSLPYYIKEIKVKT